jgi:hypothetical protein
VGTKKERKPAGKGLLSTARRTVAIHHHAA